MVRLFYHTYLSISYPQLSPLMHHPSSLLTVENLLPTCKILLLGKLRELIHATSWLSLQDDIHNAGGTWIDQQVVENRNWVISRSPQDLEAFNPAMVSLFAQNLVRH
jgi:protease I